MPMHNGWLAREGITIDSFGRLVGKTALNPFMLLPFAAAGWYTNIGMFLRIKHPKAWFRLRVLLALGVARYLNNALSRRVMNNWTSDKYVWSKEVVVVTGGAAGIGAHVVQLLAERGIKVVVLDIQPLTFTASANVHYFQCDLTSPAKLAVVADEVRAKVGHPTVLINNAGVVRPKPILESTERDVRFTFDVNALAHFWTIKEFMPEMVRRNHGMIVTVASFAAWLTSPGTIDYAASKSAAMAIHEGVTVELKTRYNAPRVRTVVVNQGYTKTALFTGYRADNHFFVPALEPETVAEGIVRQVLSGESGHVIMPGVGHTIPAIAGMPHWYQLKFREATKDLMTHVNGRQVVQDLDKFYADKNKPAESVDESTVLVAEHD